MDHHLLSIYADVCHIWVRRTLWTSALCVIIPVLCFLSLFLCSLLSLQSFFSILLCLLLCLLRGFLLPFQVALSDALLQLRDPLEICRSPVSRHSVCVLKKTKHNS